MYTTIQYSTIVIIVYDSKCHEQYHTEQKVSDWCFLSSGILFFLGNGQKREYLVLFGPKTDVPENNSGRECCWPYLIGQHPLSPVLGQKRPGTPGNSYFAQLPPVFRHFMLAAR